jgi:hypothetical protein
MSRADEVLAVYRQQITTLRRAQAAGHGADHALPFVALGMGVLLGAGFPQAAATMAELYRRAHPEGPPLPVIFEGEA